MKINEIVDVYICDSPLKGAAPDTFYMEAETQYVAGVRLKYHAGF